MFDKIDIKEKNEQLEVFVKIQNLKDAGGKLKVYTSDILSVLKERNIKHGNCIRENILHNGSDHARIGTWVFELAKQKKKPAKKLVKKPRTKIVKKQED